jgi:hypothetical protein
MLPLLFACLTAENYPEHFAQAYCEKLEECEDGFSDNYDDVDACVEDATEDLDPEEYEDCEFDVEAAQGCLDAMKDADCDAWVEDAGEACQEADIYDC